MRISAKSIATIIGCGALLLATPGIAGAQETTPDPSAQQTQKQTRAGQDVGSAQGATSQVSAAAPRYGSGGGSTAVSATKLTKTEKKAQKKAAKQAKKQARQKAAASRETAVSKGTGTRTRARDLSGTGSGGCTGTGAGSQRRGGGSGGGRR